MAAKRSPDDWYEEDRPFAVDLRQLRALALKAGLEETLKWGQPCYCHEGRNIVGIGGFKAHFGLWFFEGARLEDKDGVLSNAQPGKTQMMRQWRFRSSTDIKPAAIKRYIKEAKALPPAKKTQAPAKKAPLTLPMELAAALKEDKALNSAFSTLSPSCQREYASHIREAKRAETRARRLAKIIPLIRQGAGLHDKYR